MDHRPPVLKRGISGWSNAPPALASVLWERLWRGDRLWFEQLVTDLLPEDAAHIMSQQTIGNELMAFDRAFSAEYFPLESDVMMAYCDWATMGEDDETTPWTYLREGPPMEVYGFQYSSEHTLTEDHGNEIAMLMMMMGPTAAAPHAQAFDDGVRVGWFSMATEQVPIATLSRIPEPPWPSDVVIAALEDGGLAETAMTCRWLCADTGVWMADAYVMPESWGDPSIYDGGWDTEYITEMTEQWHETRAILENVERTKWWIRTRPAEAMEQIIDVIERNTAWQNGMRQVIEELTA